VFTVTFAFELFFKIIAIGVRTFVRDRFNLFDALIVILSFVEIVFENGENGGSSIGALRAFRLFRLFKLFKDGDL
jgi:voltage-dependent calcium channel T type alpha-1G